MRFAAPLIEGRLVRRYKRFLADVELFDGARVTAHCANPGAMLGLDAPGSRVYLSRWDKVGRTLPHSWEMVEAEHDDVRQLVGINTMNPNRLAAEALAASAIPELAGYDVHRREVKYGKASRVDFLLEGQDRPACYLEVKNCHLMRRRGLAEFPDCTAARSARHLVELGDMVAAGFRAVNLFVVQMQAETFTLAADLDPAYAAAAIEAASRGVEIIVATCRVTPDEIVISRQIPYVAPRLAPSVAGRRARSRKC
jgi:sugar fermentation stimulation protein A